MGKLRDLFNQLTQSLHIRANPVNQPIDMQKQSTQNDENADTPIIKNSYAEMIYKESHNDIKEAIDHLHHTLEHLNFPTTKKNNDKEDDG